MRGSLRILNASAVAAVVAVVCISRLPAAEQSSAPASSIDLFAGIKTR